MKIQTAIKHPKRTELERWDKLDDGEHRQSSLIKQNGFMATFVFCVVKTPGVLRIVLLLEVIDGEGDRGRFFTTIATRPPRTVPTTRPFEMAPKR